MYHNLASALFDQRYLFKRSKGQGLRLIPSHKGSFSFVSSHLLFIVLFVFRFQRCAVDLEAQAVAQCNHLIEAVERKRDELIQKINREKELKCKVSITDSSI